MEIEIDLQKEDWKKYQSYIERELPRRHKTWLDNFWVSFFVWTFMTIIFMMIYRSFTYFHWPTATFVATCFIFISALFFFNIYKARLAFEPLDAGAFCGTHKFVFSEQSIISEGKGYDARHSWMIVKRVERAAGMILIYMDTAFAFVFPESKLSDPDKFYQFIMDQFSRAKNQSTVSLLTENDSSNDQR
jgi:hypothetical protein